MLADWAQEIGGKLYIQGGGFSRLYGGGHPSDFALAGKVLVPWDQTNRQLDMAFRLFDEDGGAVLDENQKQVALQGKLEVGRPPGLTLGTELDMPFAVGVRGLTLQAGRYRWELSVGGDPVADVVFDVLAPPGTPAMPG